MSSQSAELVGTKQLLPEFERPPVTEVVLSVQFEPLPKLKSLQVGLLWGQFKSRFPQTEEHPPLPPVIETFGAPNSESLDVRFELMDSLPSPRTWFVTERGDQLIQVQQDRFVHNWRRRDDSDEYPRYDRIVTSFREELHEFCEFLANEGIGELVFNQCEVTYVNHLAGEADWNVHDSLERALTLWSGKYSDDFLQKPEDERLAIRYVITNSTNTRLGRLHFSANPAFRTKDKKPVVVLTITARSRPEETGVNGVNQALDLGHEWVVRGFTSITTPYMHQIWGRRK